MCLLEVVLVFLGFLFVLVFWFWVFLGLRFAVHAAHMKSPSLKKKVGGTFQTKLGKLTFNSPRQTFHLPRGDVRMVGLSM